jgi:mono/diheme cytochrome c family protein
VRVASTIVLWPLLVAVLVGVSEARQAKALADIVASGSVTVCADPDNLPFSSADPHAPGYDVEVMRSIAAELGARAELKWVSTVSARRAMANLIDGECDLFPGLPLSPGFADEYPRLGFSRPYYTMRHVIVTRAGAGVSGVTDLRSGPTAVEALSYADLFLLGRGYPRRTYRTQQAAFEVVRSGKARAALLWAPTAGWLTKRSSVPGLVFVAVSDADLAVDFGIAFLRGDPSLKPALDQAITRLEASGAIAASLGRYGVPRLEGRSGQVRSLLAAQASGDDRPDPMEGRFLFEANCEQCHGIDGRGGGAVPRLQTYPLGGEIRFVTTVLEGRNERGMPPWRGLITEAQARSIFTYVHALVPHMDFVPGASADERARQVFGEVCATCHGRQGAGTRIAPSLQAFKGTDDEFVDTVLNGRPKTVMAPFHTIVSAEVARKIRDFVRELARIN